MENITALVVGRKEERKKNQPTCNPPRTGTVFVQPDKHWYCFQGNLGGTAERRGRALMGLSEYCHAVVYRNWKRLVSGWVGCLAWLLLFFFFFFLFFYLGEGRYCFLLALVCGGQIFFYLLFVCFLFACLLICLFCYIEKKNNTTN